jgi:hypothetical protein
MKYIITLMLIVVYSYSWEINTHRAIDREAIKKSSNLQSFIDNSNINLQNYPNEKFEGYTKIFSENYTYLDYVTNGETIGISNENWKQIFSNSKAKSLIEAGAILEDALWPNSLIGRYLNHFYDAQNGGDGLWWNLSSLDWGEGLTYKTSTPFNYYSYPQALTYFQLAFTESNPIDRKKYQAKLLVSIGHLLHLMNDMTSPAHTRGDAHPNGDVMEICGRGGESGNVHRGFRIEGNVPRDYLGLARQNGSITLPNIPKYSKFSDFISQESYWVSTHFFSNDTIFTKPLPAVSDTYQEFVSDDGVVEKYYIRSDGTVGIPGRTKLGIRIKSYIINALSERYYTGDASKIVLNKSTSFKGDYTVLEENARILIPRAIANARNFLDYFFRGQIEAKIDGSNITIKNISDPNLVKDGHTATLQYGGSFRFKYTTRYDNTLRDFEFMRDLDRAIPNIESIGEGPLTIRTGFVPLVSLAPGESIVVAIKRDTSITSKNIVVVYDGVIGNERGLAVCSAQTPSVMAN